MSQKKIAHKKTTTKRAPKPAPNGADPTEVQS